MLRLAADLDKAAASVPRRARGAGARVVDQVAAAAKEAALATWTRYGRGEAGAAGTIRGRMSRNPGAVRGYVFAEGGAVFQEGGTANHAPQPVLGPAAEQHAPAWAAAMGDAGEQL
jgi:hypothetical protein